MFNLFGSLFFGRSNVEEMTPTAVTVNNDACTQTGLQGETVAQGVTDWVIVEKTASVAPGLASVCTSTVGLEAEEPTKEDETAKMVCENGGGGGGGDDDDGDDDDVLLGSFFDRNLDETRPVRAEDWLITPLPCLTSITGSQRCCMLESDPLENLLIEHPSMSVFVTLTSSSSFADTQFCIMQSTDEKKTTPSMLKKRKQPAALSEQVNVNSHSGENSPTSTIKRKGKKNKTASSSAAVSVVNKENMQARNLLMSELRKQTALGGAKLDAIILNKNQMKRTNKLNANKFNTVNIVQRKFHKLQQPTF